VNSVGWGDMSRKGVRIVVADNGSGIPREIRYRLFEPFFTTKGEKGTGLGLWVSQSLVEKHGGQLRVRSTPGVGTAFSIFLPTSIANAKVA
jgi:signal transduction histidine kinase